MHLSPSLWLLCMMTVTRSAAPGGLADWFDSDRRACAQPGSELSVPAGWHFGGQSRLVGLAEENKVGPVFVLELRASTFELADFSTFSTEKSCVSVGSRSPLHAGAAQCLGSWFCFLFFF